MTDSQGEDVTVTTGTSSGDATITVNTGGETDTSTATSSGKETDRKSKESSGAEGTEDVGGKFVPYSRFAEVNEKAKRVSELEAKVRELEGNRSVTTPPSTSPLGVDKEKVKTAIKELGFVPTEEVQEMLRQKDDDDALKQELTRLEQRYDGSDGRPKFDKKKVVKFALDHQIGDPEAAYKILHEAEITDWHIQQAMNKSRGIKTEVSTGTGADVGPSNEDLKVAMSKGDSVAKSTFFKRLARQALGTE